MQGSNKLRFQERDHLEVKQENDDKKHKVSISNNKKAKIIVRNLPFKNLSEKKLKEWFQEYGEIKEVNLLRKDDGKFVGCGFVQFAKVTSAAKAVHNANQKEISGRKIIVDWAVPKHVYLDSLRALQQNVKEEPYDPEMDDAENSEELPYWIDKNPSQDRDSNSCEDSNSEEGSEDYDIEEDKNTLTETKTNVQQKMPVKSNDVEKGQTIFVRNLPFSATNDDLKNCFSKFGKVEYALICIDKLTEHSKGTGFVKFKDKSSVDACLLQNNKIFIEDSPLLLSLAVSRETLEENKKKKVVKDSRNLYLAKEGVITAGSVASRGVSAADMAKRLEIEQLKTQMLKNLNMFISDKRLLIHNLPPTYNDAQLKALFLKYTHPKAVITEARVMRDKKKVDGKTGLGISKEFGFVSFSNHEDALMALRNMNNNPKIFSIKKRPIISFSIESKAALNLKKKRLEKSRAKLGLDNDKIPEKLLQLNRKQRRFIRRRQKFIEKRREAKKLKKGTIEVEEKGNKRKLSNVEKVDTVNKKRRTQEVTETVKPEAEFRGLTSAPGSKVMLRTRFKLKNQLRLHNQQLKEEKSKMKKKRKVEEIKQPKHKQGKRKLNDDSKVSKLLTKRRKALDGVSSYKKWDEK